MGGGEEEQRDRDRRIDSTKYSTRTNHTLITATALSRICTENKTLLAVVEVVIAALVAAVAFK